ncbi:hypothetical protein GQ53DRAFT_226377 [Thozetella sp. PMI_491]|nr:hypothetical protein GQ53DRAFT_226377 [Thozetella sp. PMI_491]
MGKIYSQASQVIIWLGRATEGSRLAMDLLDQIASSPQSTDEEILEMITSRPGVEYKLRRLLHLRIYWTRLWILQEVILAKSIVIYCGKHRLPWASLTVSIRRLQEGMPHFKSPPHAFSRPSRPIYTALSRSLDSIFSIRLDSIRSERYTSSPPDTDLRKLMGICQWSECSVRRDKLYGCLGMFDSTMPVDYQKPPFEVYTDAIRHIKHPNVRGPSDLCDFYTVRFSRIVQRLLSGPMTSSSSVVPCFRIKGILGGTIIGLGKPSSTQGPAWTGWRANESARQIPKVVDESGEPNIAGLFESMPPEYGEGVHLSSQNCKPHYFTVHLSAEGVSPKFPETVPTSGNVPVAKNSNDTSSDSRKFVASSTKPLTGYAPPSALVGDLVVRFLYSDTSIIIRRSKEGFSFVGRAFIPRQYKSEPSPYISESREIDNVPLSGDIIGRDELALHTEHLDIVIDGELLQFISNYKEFEKNT